MRYANLCMLSAAYTDPSDWLRAMIRSMYSTAQHGTVLGSVRCPAALLHRLSPMPGLRHGAVCLTVGASLTGSLAWYAPAAFPPANYINALQQAVIVSYVLMWVRAAGIHDYAPIQYLPSSCTDNSLHVSIAPRKETFEPR